MSLPTRYVRLSQPSTSTGVTGRSLRCGNNGISGARYGIPSALI
jgi:hypothetical protein